MAREIPVAEHMEKQLAAGRKVIATDAQSRALFAQLKSECPDVDEDAIVRSFATPGFGTKNVEAAVVATVRQKQFNILNPRVPFKDVFDHLLPPKLAKEVRDDPEYRAQFADLLAEIEAEHDPKGISDVDMRKEIQDALK
ncbi:MAG TPA: hypothetical protein VFH47_00920 [Candidatus Thermoplasmatota archaeon]|nr:hypothetical protein [Candidatus Thermoplasmatota archaeon]